MPLLMEFSVRAVLLVVAVAVTLAALRVKSPRIAHRAWVGVALALIALPVVVAWGPVVAIPFASDAPRWMAPGPVALPPPDVVGDTHPAPGTAIRATASSADAARRGRMLFALYAAGALVLLARIVVGLVLASALRRRARRIDGRLTSVHCSTPVTVGLRAPVVILPEGWTSWPGPELAAVLAHEQEHARCRDPLATLVTLVARALFWFHPVAWWLPRHVARLSEQACDAAVLARGHDADVYAASLVRFARAQARAGARLMPAGAAMGGVALAKRLNLLQNPVPARPGRARMLGALAGYAIAVCLSCAGAPAAAMAINPAQPQVSPKQPADGWRAVSTEHFDIYFPDEQAHLVDEVARQAEEAYAELRAAFRYDLPERVALALLGGDIELHDAAVTGPAFDRVPTDLSCELTTTDQALSGTCTAPGTRATRQVLLVPAQAIEPARRLLVHELTHQFAFNIVPEPSRTAPWLIEGLAEHQRGVWDAASVRAVRDAAGGAWVPTVDALANADRHWAHAFFDFIADTYGRDGVRRYLFALRTSPRISDALPAAFGARSEDVDRAFRRYVAGRFGTL